MGRTKPTASQIRAFRKKVLDCYSASGRKLPWRAQSCSPYQVLVSEIMLQQTQVDRVVPKFREFIRTFPSLRSLAVASTKDVLTAWQGLGYNRRALGLQRCAQQIVANHGGRVPRSPEQLQALPGIGPATAASIAAYAFGVPTVYIETNIRTVYIQEFFAGKEGVRDDELLPLVEMTLHREDPSRWYNALMDYGVSLKKRFGNPSRKSAHHTRQSRFAGSDRQIRGEVLRVATEGDTLTPRIIADRLGVEPTRVDRLIRQMADEGFLARRGRAWVAAG